MFINIKLSFISSFNLFRFSMYSVLIEGLINGQISCGFSERSMRIAPCQHIRIRRFFMEGLTKYHKGIIIKTTRLGLESYYAQDVGNLLHKNLVER